MIEKLRSHLRSEKGFTLIELLVVIAIIAILVVIVVVAINPAERLREAADRRASSNVRSAGTLISTCITRTQGVIASCDTAGEVEGAAGGDGNLPNTITFGASATDICASEVGRAGTTWFYRHTTGEVSSTTAAFTC